MKEGQEGKTAAGAAGSEGGVTGKVKASFSSEVPLEGAAPGVAAGKSLVASRRL